MKFACLKLNEQGKGMNVGFIHVDLITGNKANSIYKQRSSGSLNNAGILSDKRVPTNSAICILKDFIVKHFVMLLNITLKVDLITMDEG